MAQLLGSESTSFTLDNMGRFFCNTLQEALESAAQTVAGRKRDFDLIVIGGGTFGAVVAEHLMVTDATRSRRILVLEAGPFVLPRENTKTCPFELTATPVTSPRCTSFGILTGSGAESNRMT